MSKLNTVGHTRYRLF